MTDAALSDDALPEQINLLWALLNRFDDAQPVSHPENRDADRDAHIFMSAAEVSTLRGAFMTLQSVQRLRASSAGVRSAAIEECARLLEGWKPGNFTKSEIVEKMRALAPGGGGVPNFTNDVRRAYDMTALFPDRGGWNGDGTVTLSGKHFMALLLCRNAIGSVLKATPAGGA